MVVVFYRCHTCMRDFSFLYITRKEGLTRVPLCPWCQGDDLVLLYKETW